MNHDDIHYRLDANRQPIQVPGVEAYLWKADCNEWIVGKAHLNGSEVSTVFLLHDHDFTGKGPPVLFETFVFGGLLDGQCERCCTWDEAVDMHRRMVERVRTEVTGLMVGE